MFLYAKHVAFHAILQGSHTTLRKAAGERGLGKLSWDWGGGGRWSPRWAGTPLAGVSELQVGKELGSHPVLFYSLLSLPSIVAFLKK